MKFSAAILSGGQNTRFGGEMKSLAMLNNRPILEYIIHELHKIFSDLILVTNTPELFSDYKRIRIIGDVIPNKGALSGIHSALYHSTNENLFVVAGDMPFIKHEIIQKEITLFETMQVDLLVPKHTTNTEFLHGIYSKNLIPHLEEVLQRGTNLSLGAFTSQMKTFYWETNYYKGFENINTMNDLKKWTL